MSCEQCNRTFAEGETFTQLEDKSFVCFSCWTKRNNKVINDLLMTPTTNQEDD